MNLEQIIATYLPNPTDPPLGWPKALVDEALYGLAGDVVRVITPYSEADPAGLLLQTLVMFGNAIGRGPHFMAEADYHPANLFVAIVGQSSRARKGTSAGIIRQLFRGVDPAWEANQIQTGLSTGEGLVKSICPVGAESAAVDKRLLVIEEEFTRTLRVMTRPASTLSPLLRSAWDSRKLQVLTKTSPLSVVGGHISLIVHSTWEDLARYLGQTDLFNGFANRFLWIAVRFQALARRRNRSP